MRAGTSHPALRRATFIVDFSHADVVPSATRGTGLYGRVSGPDIARPYEPMNRNGLDGRLSIRVLYIHHAGAFGGASRRPARADRRVSSWERDAASYLPAWSVAPIFAERGIEIVKATGTSQFDTPVSTTTGAGAGWCCCAKFPTCPYARRLAARPVYVEGRRSGSRE